MTRIPLAQRLPALLPKAIAWAEATALWIARTGQPLSEQDLALARRVGVAQPERVRTVEVDQMPWPEEAELRSAGMETGLFGPDITGMTLGHGILLVRGRINRQLMAHELRHVHQYEAAGSIATFLPRYLIEVATMGYGNAPSEIDARNHQHLASEID